MLRRQFLAASAVAAASFGLPHILRGARRLEDADPYGGFPMGIQSYTLRNFNLAEALRHIEGLKLHFVEFFGAHFATDSNDAQIKEMQAQLDRAKLKISAHGV